MAKQIAADVTGNACSRVAEHRAQYGRLDVSIPLHLEETIADLARENHAKKADVVRILLRFALTNRDWKSQGLLWGLADL